MTLYRTASGQFSARKTHHPVRRRNPESAIKRRRAAKLGWRRRKR